MKQYRAWYDNNLFEMVHKPDDVLYFRMVDDPKCCIDFMVPFIDSDYVVEEGLDIYDITGKEIFDGDIEKGYEGKTRVFCWHFNRWVLRSEKGKIEEINKTWADYHKYEIIGNIHTGAKQ